MNPPAGSDLADREQTIADLQRRLVEAQRRLDECTVERDEALARELATTEVLAVINASPANLTPVFDAILEKAMRLCGATFGMLNTYDGKCFHYGAEHGVPAAYAEFRKRNTRAEGHVYGAGTSPTRMVDGEDLIHNPDLKSEEAYQQGEHHRRALVDLGGARSHLAVALRKDETLLGFLAIYRQEVRPFTDKQIALLQNFAAQAVIAIENARLLTETREALEQQTATAEVLGVINSSPGDLAPVFDAILEKAMKLCGAAFGELRARDGDSFRSAATRGVPVAFAEYRRDNAFAAEPGSLGARILAGDQVVHVLDLKDEDVYRAGYRNRRALVDLGGARTALVAALRKEDNVLGFIIVYRQEVRPFTDQQIAVLRNFADQAVIAMENARLITETREALEQQTATAEVLQIINASPGDLAPVFDAILEKAHSLCRIDFGSLNLYEAGKIRAVAVRTVAEDLADLLRQPVEPVPGSRISRLIAGERFVQITDIVETAKQFPNDARVQLTAARGLHTGLFVPLRKEAEFLGYITGFSRDVRSFSDKEIAVLENFAAQAVIAMENARLITETREALEQQTGTAEVLQVINSSPGDLAPVFDAILDKAQNLCGAAFGLLFTYDGEHIDAAALHNIPAGFAQFLRQGPVTPAPGTALASAVQQRSPIQIVDVASAEPYRAGDPFAVVAVKQGGVRTVLSIPMIKDDAVLGVIAVFRQEVRPFSDKQIALLENFAAQAVIAMENARLITETREALEQQSATAEVLGVINSSPGDLGPVFQRMLERGLQLCDARFGILGLYEGNGFHGVAAVGFPPDAAEGLTRVRHPPPETALGRALATNQTIQVIDISTEPAYTPVFAANPALRSARTNLVVPMLKEGLFAGAIIVFRDVVRPFSDKQIALLQNFAAQAVIAIENARLITETREALEQQTATAEVLGVINSSPGDLTPVFDAILDKAHTLCEATLGALMTYDGVDFRAVATHGLPHALAWRLRGGFRGADNPVTQPLLEGAPFVHLLDLGEIDHPVPRAAAQIGGVRTGLLVPLRQDGKLLGYINAYRLEIAPFTDKQIGLLQNFAAQAVIAMENARLITETREALEQQTATAEVLGVINSSPGDLAPVFEAMLKKAARLCSAGFGALWLYDGKQFHAAAMHAVPAGLADFAREPMPAEDSASLVDIVRGQGVVHVPDMAASALYHAGNPARRAYVDLGGARTLLSVALRKENSLLGAFTIYRQEVRPFSDKEITLVENFAAQAVIAIENTRLITETREALERQTATSEVLQVINSSPGDLAPVFDAMLQKAMYLCDAAFGILWMFDKNRLNPTATRGVPEGFTNHRFDTPPGPSTAAYRFLSGERSVIQNMDLADEDAYRAGDPLRRSLVDLAGARSALHAPLCKDNAVLGVITIYRQEVRPFNDKQIALLQNFAAQAVIAIENARLLDEIRQRQAELRVTFDNMADGVAMFDEQMRLAAWNRNFQQIADLPESLLAARPTYAEYLRVLADRGELDIGTIDQELTDRLEHTDQELRLERARPNGQVIEVRRNAVPDGGFVLIYSDITERKRSEAEIRAARDAAEAAYSELKAAQSNLVQAQKMAALGQLTAGIAHEIKNPLNFVNNFAGLSVELLDELKETAAPALDTLDQDERAEVNETIELLAGNLEKIAEHGKRADNIVKSMLEHSRNVSGERREVDLNALVEEALNLAYHGARAQDQTFNITMERAFDGALKPIEVAPQEITRVFLNLFGNGFYAANKRSHENSSGPFRPTLTVSTNDLGDAVEVRVRDNGIGIPPDIKEKLFQPFFTTKPTGEGTGLGLSISYDIVTQQHDGTIQVDSEVGEFTEFTVRLPRVQTAGRATA